MEFKQLDLKPEGSRLKRLSKSPHVRKSALYILIGAIIGLAYFYFTEGRHVAELSRGDMTKSVLIGGFFGFFITNSPCARNKC
jgi:hypothetical protein